MGGQKHTWLGWGGCNLEVDERGMPRGSFPPAIYMALLLETLQTFLLMFIAENGIVLSVLGYGIKSVKINHLSFWSNS